MTELLPVAKGYVRVSTAMQADEGVSIATQKARIEEHCRYKRLNLIEIYVDGGISGKDMENRPELLRLLKDVKKGEYVVICDLSRLSRSTKDSLTILEDIKQKGAILMCLNPDIDYSTPVGSLVFTMLSAVAKMERENISTSVKNNLQRLSKDNKLRSCPPFGYKFVAKDKNFEPVPEQQAVIKKIIELFIKDPCITRVVNKLNEDGDYKVLNLNRHMTKERKFTRYLVSTILVDHGILEPTKCYENRKSLEDRVKTHKGTSSTSTEST